MATEKLKVIFEVNEADLKRFNELLKAADINAKQLQDDSKKAGKEAGDAFGQAAAGINQMVAGVKAFLGLQLVKEIAGAAIEASKFAAAAEGIQSAFKNLGGTDANLKKLSDAVGGTISNINLMKFAVQALQRGLNFDQVTKVVDLLNRQANATGKSFEELGTKALKSMKDVPSLMKETAKQTALLGEVVGDTGDAYARVGVAQENLKLAVGNFINSQPVSDALNFFAKTLDWFARITGPNVVEGTSDALIAEANQITLKIDELTKKIDQYRSRPRIFQKMFGLTETDAEEARKELVERWQAINAELIKRSHDTGSVAGTSFVDAYNDAVKKANEKSVEQRAKERFEDLKKVEIAAINKANVGDIGKTLNDQIGKRKESRVAPRTGDKSLSKDALDEFEDVQSALGEVNTLVGQSASTTEKVKTDFESIAASALVAADALLSLGDNNDPKGKKFFSIVQLLIGLAGTVLGGPAGFAIAGQAVGVFGKLFSRNQGGIIPGSGPDRDSVLLHATPGEFVTKRSSTQRSPLLLDAINSGELDDKIFKRLTAQQPVVYLNQDQVVEAIQNMPQVELYKSGSALYEARKIAGERRTSIKQRLSF